jgi:hypothetical protein
MGQRLARQPSLDRAVEVGLIQGYGVNPRKGDSEAEGEAVRARITHHP